MSKRITLALLSFAFTAKAQSVDLKSLPTEGENTTIEIHKGAKKEDVKKAKFQIETGESDVEGEPGATERDARAEWKTACDTWKKEFRADNKDNVVLAINCNHASCSGDAGNKTCTSKASYKIKTRVEE